ncbi:isopentenyl-diphosphate Delta-isomerase [Acidipropionibacterium jensenii]|uniref:isopentenyl-diphosphate Delta-isomerase n=1 Tax=Acidipropionibacterium jensenii TaxID=1749 RepID=UPI000BC3472D|nr:isopentenyl-diphosphate Delta-isomerase [Acidipropionibacterium jensenii]AZZ41063.1 isopentenyl-diphosphate Delta-isomerase [Acidipropionibacterium jensenii]
MTSQSESGAGPASDGEAIDDQDDLVVLLDRDGHQIGTAPRLAVHTRSTPRHLAFSCHILDVGGRVLITRRALGKVSWPGVWTNSCCGHPRPGEKIPDAIERRVREELGLDVNPSTMVCAIPDFSYRATDASGIVEDELCPVYLALLDDPEEIVELYPDPEEVEEVAWVGWKDLYRTVQTMSPLLSPWSVLQVRQLGEDISAHLP